MISAFTKDLGLAERKLLKKKRKHLIPGAHIDSLIHTIRGEKIILDSDLAAIYEVTAKRLNEQFGRNRKRFPNDFCFQLTQEEWKTIKAIRSQNATLNKGRGKHRKYLPHAFTEHGAIMAANVLNSPRAIQMSVFVVRAFVKMRQTMTANKALLEKLEELEKKLTKRLDAHEQGIVYVLSELRKLMEPPQLPELKRRRIGFQRDEEERE